MFKVRKFQIDRGLATCAPTAIPLLPTFQVWSQYPCGTYDGNLQMKPLLRSKSYPIQVIQIAMMAIALIYLLSVAPSRAQNNNQAPIVLDGHRLFEVSESGRHSAQERASEANAILEKIVLTVEPPVDVTIEENNKIPVIKVNGKHLLSVTSEDAPAGRLPTAQAEIWQENLDKAIEQAYYERTPGYLTKAIIISLSCILLAIASHWGLGWLWRRWFQPLLNRSFAAAGNLSTTHQRTNLEIGVQVPKKIIQGVIWLSTLIYISRQFLQTRQLSQDVVNILGTSFNIIISSLTSGLFTLGDTKYSIFDLLVLFCLFIGLIFIAKTLRKLLRTRVLSLTGLNRATQETIAQIANYTFVFIGTIVVLQLWGLDISSLAVFAGVLGVGIGLGVQGIAREFVSGLVLIFERPIQVGDFVDISGLVGTIERINVRSTEIRTLDHISIIIPNSRFLEAEVVNWSHKSPVSRLNVPVGVAYGSNLSDVRGALIDAAKEHPDILSEPSPQVFFTGFGDSSLDFNLLVWISEPPRQFRIKSDLYFQIEANLRDCNVEIPFPQRDLHVRSGSLPLDVSPHLMESLTQLSSSLAKWLEIQANMTSQDGHKSKVTPEQEETSKH
ncbi:MAG: mechanosensitive ion channel domain-containing protein [Coleofasciculaceae cyanobacterium]